MPSFAKQGSAMLSSFLSLIGAGERNLADSYFAGVWQVKDTDGNAFEITLFASGLAEANRAAEGMSGTWTESDDKMSALIDWDTGWTTKITRAGDAFVKTAYNMNAAAPVNTSLAEKVED